MLTGIHFLLTYTCNRECDHCFVYGGPQAEGTFTLKQLKAVFSEITKIKTVNSAYFEGGEPFLYYPLMVEGIKIARDIGLQTGIVTNAYWATDENDATLWLKPLAELGVSDLSISDDSFHSNKERGSFGKNAILAAEKLGIPASLICIEEPEVKLNIDKNQAKGEPIIGGDVKFRGRAAEKLAEDLPTQKWSDFTECPYEDLKNPQRVHIDSYGNVHLCQGLIIGNMWQTPLSKIFRDYDCNSHPVCQYLTKGGPALLAKQYRVKHDDGYIDACHLCYLTRLSLLDKYPQYLAPRQVYGV